jgi:hypothetical protein
LTIIANVYAPVRGLAREQEEFYKKIGGDDRRVRGKVFDA